MAEQRKKLRLGELLIQQGLISLDQLRIALTQQKQEKIPIGRQLVKLDRKSTRLNSSHIQKSRMPSSA